MPAQYGCRLRHSARLNAPVVRGGVIAPRYQQAQPWDSPGPRLNDSARPGFRQRVAALHILGRRIEQDYVHPCRPAVGRLSSWPSKVMCLPAYATTFSSSGLTAGRAIGSGGGLGVMRRGADHLGDRSAQHPRLVRTGTRHCAQDLRRLGSQGNSTAIRQSGAESQGAESGGEAICSRVG